MADSSADRDPLELLAEQFVTRFRAGERPSLTEYAERHPDLATEIRDLFPALVEMEQLKPVSADHTGAFTPSVEPTDPIRVGEFRILRQAGRGGMGVVYEAVQESLGRHVALKILPIDALADTKRLERFRREAKAAARLHHTNIVPVFGVGEADGRHYYAMQFIAGHPLDAVIDEVRRLKDKSAVPLPRAISEVAVAMMTGTFAPRGEPGLGEPSDVSRRVPENPAADDARLANSLSDGGRHFTATVARIGAQVADALAYAHGQGILHRDIKPANLLLDLQGTVWVTDFGLAKANDTDDLTHAGDVVGTLRYMAPERFDGPGDARSDVYALGLTLYELLTLRPAFVAENRAKLVQEVTAASPPSPRSVNPLIPRDLETIVLKAIARDPAMRYQSAGELAEDLRRYLEDRPIRARRASSAEQAWRWCRRNKAVASLLTTVMIVFALGAAVATFFAYRADKERQVAQHRQQQLDDERTNAIRLAKEADDARQVSDGRAAALRGEQDFTSRLLYVSRINQAQAALNDKRGSRVLELLRDTTPALGQPDRRGWEWHYLNRQIQPDREVTIVDEGATDDRNRFPLICDDGSRVFLPQTVEGGVTFEVRETQTGRLVGRIPRSGTIAMPPLNNGVGGASAMGDGISIRPTLSPEGRFALVIFNKSDGKGMRAVDMDRSRLWNVDTGEETRLPPEVASAAGPNSTLILGAEGATLTWLRLPGKVDPPRGVPTDYYPAPVETICYRWDRASNRVTESRPFSVGRGTGRPILARDGRTVYWAVGRRPLEKKMNFVPPDPDPFPNPIAGGPWFECWDVTTAEPKLRFEPKRMPARTGLSSSPSLPILVFNNSGTMVLVRLQPDEAAIFRVADGVEHARIKLPGVPAAPANPLGEGEQLFDLSDDGNRVVVRLPNMLCVVDRTETGETGRQYLMQDDRPLMMSTLSMLLPDGKTYLDLQSNRYARFWDVTRDPNNFVPTPKLGGPIVERNGEPHATATTPDGRFTLEWPSNRVQEINGPGTWKTAFFLGPVVVRDAAGRELGRIRDCPEFLMVTAESLNEGRQLLIRFNPPGGPRVPGMMGNSGYVWELFDTDGGMRRIDGGTGSVTALPREPYLVERSSTARGFSPTVYPALTQSIRLRHSASGQVFRTIEMPGRLVMFCGFDAARRTYLVQSMGQEPDEIPAPRRIPTNAELAIAGGPLAVISLGAAPESPLGGRTAPRLPEVRSIRVHLFETATGKELWSRDIVGAEGLNLFGQAQFAPDGNRIVLRYETVVWRSVVPGGTPFPDRDCDRIWIARTDGTVERDFVVRVFQAFTNNRWGRRPSSSSSGLLDVAFSPDKRHMAIPMEGDVQIWDLDTATMKHRLTGHNWEDFGSIDVVYNADGTRLFTRDPGSQPGRRGVAGGRINIHVWDTTTGRELLSFPVQAQTMSQGLRFEGDQLLIDLGDGTKTFDGREVKK